MAAVIGQVTQQSGTFIRIDPNGNEHPLKAGDKIHKGDKVISKGGEQLIVTLDNDESLTLDQNSALVFDASVIGAELFAKEDVTVDEFSLDALLETGPIDVDAVAETAAGAQANEGYVSGATGVDRLGESGDAKADTSSMDLSEDSHTNSFSAYNPMSFAGIDTILDTQTQTKDLPQGPGQEGTTPPVDIIGSDLDDTLTGSGDNDTISGEAGDDTLMGEDGNDLIAGGDGDDIISGNNGDDTLLGNDGDDTISGGEGDDIIQGGAGDDTLMGGAGDDSIDGGEGDDTLILDGNRDDYTVIENDDGSTIIIDNRDGSPEGTVVVQEVETFQFNDQTLSSSDLVDSNTQENDAADTALETATQSLLAAQDTVNETNTLLETVINAQNSLDLDDPSDLADAEASLDMLLQDAEDSLTAANDALQDAQEALVAAQDALDTAQENGESTDEESARLEEVQELLINAQDLVNQASETLETTQEMIQDLESQTIEPTLDLPTDTLLTDATPNLSGNAEAGSTVTISIDGVIMGSVVADSEGIWEYETDTLSEGEHTIELSSSDEEGNTANSDPVTVTVDAQADAPNLDITVTAVEEVTIETPNEGHHGWFNSHGCENEEENVFDYTLDIRASLNDSNETLSDLTLTLPEGVTLFDANGNPVEENSDGTYTLDLSQETNTELIVRSDELLSNDELASITGEITSTNSDDQTATTQTGAQVDENVTFNESSEGDLDFTHIGDFHDHDHHGGHHHGDDDNTLAIGDLFPQHHDDNIFDDEPCGQISSNHNGVEHHGSMENGHHGMDQDPLKIEITTHIDDV